MAGFGDGLAREVRHQFGNTPHSLSRVQTALTQRVESPSGRGDHLGKRASGDACGRVGGRHTAEKVKATKIRAPEG